MKRILLFCCMALFAGESRSDMDLPTTTSVNYTWACRGESYHFRGRQFSNDSNERIISIDEVSGVAHGEHGSQVVAASSQELKTLSRQISAFGSRVEQVKLVCSDSPVFYISSDYKLSKVRDSVELNAATVRVILDKQGLRVKVFPFKRPQ